MTEQQQAANLLLRDWAVWTFLGIVLLFLMLGLVLLIWRLRKRTHYRPTWRPTVHDWTTHKHLTPRG